MKSPKIGDWVVYEEPSFDRKTEGEVILLLSAQFMIKEENGNLRHVMYSENWKKKKIADAEISKQKKEKAKSAQNGQ